MEIEISQNGPEIRITPIGAVIGTEANDVATVCRVRMDVDPKPEEVLLDLSKTTQMDSAGIGMLVGVRAHAKARKVKFSICNPNEQVKYSLRTANLNHLFNIPQL